MTNRDREEALLKLTEAALMGPGRNGTGNAYSVGKWAAVCAKAALVELEKNEWTLIGRNTPET